MTGRTVSHWANIANHSEASRTCWLVLRELRLPPGNIVVICAWTVRCLVPCRHHTRGRADVRLWRMILALSSADRRMGGMPTGTSILALCGTDPGSGNGRLAKGWGFPERGPVTVRKPHHDETPGQQRFR